jgi:mRNA interferase MazF
MKKGDIVLLPFPFTDLTGNKNRPALILISNQDNVTVSFITTQLKWKSDFDILIEPTSRNGLKRQSLIRLDKFATIDKNLVIGKLGDLNNYEMDLLNHNLIKILKLG